MKFYLLDLLIVLSKDISWIFFCSQWIFTLVVGKICNFSTAVCYMKMLTFSFAISSVNLCRWLAIGLHFLSSLSLSPHIIQAGLCNWEANGPTVSWKIGLHTVQTSARNSRYHIKTIGEAWGVGDWGHFFLCNMFLHPRTSSSLCNYWMPVDISEGCISLVQ